MSSTTPQNDPSPSPSSPSSSSSSLPGGGPVLPGVDGRPAWAAGAIGFVVLDAALPSRPPLARAADYTAALRALKVVQERFYAQLAVSGEGGNTAQLALAVAPLDAAGAVGLPCCWVTINGVRPARR